MYSKYHIFLPILISYSMVTLLIIVSIFRSGVELCCIEKKYHYQIFVFIVCSQLYTSILAVNMISDALISSSCIQSQFIIMNVVNEECLQSSVSRVNHHQRSPMVITTMMCECETSTREVGTTIWGQGNILGCSGEKSYGCVISYVLETTGVSPYIDYRYVVY